MSRSDTPENQAQENIQGVGIQLIKLNNTIRSEASRDGHIRYNHMRRIRLSNNPKNGHAEKRNINNGESQIDVDQ